jgi:hypothetical protein
VSIEIETRLRAALLWDRPTLNGFGADPGVRQWIDVMNLEFSNFGSLDSDDVLSRVAHALRAGVVGERDRAREYRNQLELRGPIGLLLADLVALTLGEFDLSESRESLERLHGIVTEVDDLDLRVRLLLRITQFATRRRIYDVATRASANAVLWSDGETRLGVVARRWAAEFGVAPEDFVPWASTNTPDDPLLGLSWVHASVVEKSTKTVSARFERFLSGVWDSSFHLGRTARDDLMAAELQAGWCGNIALRSQVRRLLAIDILSEEGAASEEVRWALRLWASEPGVGRIGAAIRASEHHLDSESASELFEAVRADPEVSEDAAIEVAGGVWDLLSDSAADSLLAWLVSVRGDMRDDRRHQLIAALLWRRPSEWEEVFLNASPAVREAMASGLGPGDLMPVPPPLLRELAQNATSNEPTAFSESIRYAIDGVPVAADVLEPDALIEVLEWDSSAATSDAIRAAMVALQVAADQARLDGSAAGPVITRGQFGGLGRLSRFFGARREEVVTALIAVAGDSEATVDDQLQALEDLAVMRRAGLLAAIDLDAIAVLKLRPGPRFFGQRTNAETLRAAQLRVLGGRMGADDIAWLAAAGRASDSQIRLVAMLAFGDPDLDSHSAADWTLAGGLFDPDDEVVIAALESLSRRGLGEETGAHDLVSGRLGELVERGRRDVRRAVALAVSKQPTLGSPQVTEAVRTDVSWIVRREHGMS